MNRRSFLCTGAAAAAGFLCTPPAFAADKKKKTRSDADILAQAARRIERHRKGQGTVAVRDARGLPVPGVQLRIDQVQHHFLFGCNLFNFDRCSNPEHEEKYRHRFADVFNYCTLPFYWAQYEPRRSQPDYAWTEQALAWCRPHGILAKGHPLVWDNPASSPEWLPNNPEKIQQLSDARVRDIVSRFKGQIHFWDVVNEATHIPQKLNHTKMADLGVALGPVPYTRKALRIAHEANPSATLLVNDYRTDSAYFQLLKDLYVRGQYLLDVIGIQSHMHEGIWPLHQAWDIADPYSRLGLPLHFTETTILSGPRHGDSFGETTTEGEAAQATAAADFYRILFGHPAVQAISWWDLSDYRAWQHAPGGLLRKDMSPKPAYNRLLSLIKQEWWTRIAGETGPRGNYVTRAFYGTYQITVQPHSGGRPITRQIQWLPGQANEFVFQI